ncbi:chlorohydrolase [Streptococcus pneumoniae]|nr:chlorohydrolase [Streptococcus pneumoniae]
MKIKEQTRKEIKEQTRKLAAGCSKHCFEVVDKADAV